MTFQYPQDTITEYDFGRYAAGGQERRIAGIGKKFDTAAVTETVAPRNILTERCLRAERAPVMRTVKITPEPDTLREMG